VPGNGKVAVRKAWILFLLHSQAYGEVGVLPAVGSHERAGSPWPETERLPSGDWKKIKKVASPTAVALLGKVFSYAYNSSSTGGLSAGVYPEVGGKSGGLLRAEEEMTCPS